MSAWLRLDAGTVWDPRLLDLSSDEVRWAYIEALCFAKLQTPEGVFRSAAQYTAVTRRNATTLEELLTARLLEHHPSGSLWMSDWETLQMPSDPTNKVRQRRWRARQVAQREALRNGVSNALPDQTNRTDSPPVRNPYLTEPETDARMGQLP